MAIAAAIGQPAAQSPAALPSPGVMSELGARVAAAVAPTLRVALEPGTDPALDAAVADQLIGRGVQVVGRAADVPSVRVRCLDNLRERVCSAEITGPIRTNILVTRAHEAAVTPPDIRLVVQLRPVISHDAPILDIARTGDDLLVLTPTAIERYENRDDRWQRTDTRAIAAARPWPRDTRGRLRLAAAGLEAFLPGTMCTGSIDARAITCADGNVSWPLDIDGGRLAEARNYFVTPGGLRFFGVARLGAAAGVAWLAATLDHQLAFIDEARRLEPTGELATDLAAIHVPCAPPAPHVVASTAEGNEERLAVYRVVRRQLQPAADPVSVPGRLAAVWPASAAGRATVITRDPDARRYVAHELSVSCAP